MIGKPIFSANIDIKGDNGRVGEGEHNLKKGFRVGGPY
jgi:hypothetical protein